MTGPRVLFFDIENAPNLAYVWGTYDQTIPAVMMVREWYILCWAAKWYGEDEILSAAIPDFARYKRHRYCDKAVLKALWKLLDEADIVVGHNGDRFDIRKTNARFAFHGIKPPSTYKTVDTLKVARRHFKFTSNRLGDLGEHLGLGAKLPTGGFELWSGCMDGCEESWAKMVAYNKQDVTLLEAVYEELRPWMKSHPNVTLYVDAHAPACTKCGSTKLQKRGYEMTAVSKYQRYHCRSCGGWNRGRDNLIKHNREAILSSI